MNDCSPPKIDAAGKAILIYSQHLIEVAEKAILEFYDSYSHFGPIPRKQDRFALAQHIIWAVELSYREYRERAATAPVPETVAPTVAEQSEASQ